MTTRFLAMTALGLALLAGSAGAQLIYNDKAAEPPEFELYGNYMTRPYVKGDPALLDDRNGQGKPRIAFVACPVMQDSKPTPYWFAEYKGQRYFLRAQQNFSGRVPPPMALHRVLVEGVITDEAPVGGAIVLNPVNLSVITELDPSCDTLLPDDGTGVPFAKRPPGPSSSSAYTEGVSNRARAFYQVLTDQDYLPEPVDKWEPREFVVPYQFDSDRTFRGYTPVEMAAKRALDTRSPRIELIAQRGSVLLSDGTVLEERANVEVDRAHAVEQILRDFPINAEIVIRTVAAAVKPDGIADPMNRTVRIIVYPAAKGPSAR